MSPRKTPLALHAQPPQRLHHRGATCFLGAFVNRSDIQSFFESSLSSAVFSKQPGAAGVSAHVGPGGMSAPCSEEGGFSARSGSISYGRRNAVMLLVSITATCVPTTGRIISTLGLGKRRRGQGLR